jgi:pimeloyl-ACP methyl ester carboxylesterase
MVHGFLSSRAQWRANLDGLAAFCRPVLVELLGHGRSPAPEDPGAYRVQSYMAAFEAIRQGLGAGRWLICGQSFGAGLAIQYAIEHRECTMGVIATNSISAFSPPGDAERAATQAGRLRAIEAGGKAALEALRIHPRHARRFPEAIKAELVADAERISPAAILRSIALTSPGLSVANRLEDIPVPMLLVNGRWEKRFQPMRDRASRLIPDVEVVDLEGGHSINIEAAEAFNTAVEAFAARIAG